LTLLSALSSCQPSTGPEFHYSLGIEIETDM
jgi:hypothetical protein